MILRVLKWIIGILVILSFCLVLFIYFGTYRPDEIQSENFISPPNIPELKAGQKIKVLSWNVQYMAGKNYVFFYDLLDGSGPDSRPSSNDIEQTTEAVAKLIVQENPDMILLQEVDEGASRTDNEDQLKKLMTLLPKEYSAHASSFYWRAWFVPHPKIMGKVGMKLSIISKYKIKSAIRHQLDLIETESWLMQQFNLKRAIQEVVFPVRGGSDLIVFNTHLSAFAQGSKNMQNQVAEVKNLLDQKTKQGNDWLIGGDFNLLASAKAFKSLPAKHQAYYNPESEIKPLLKYPMIPSLDEIEGDKKNNWFTHFPNDPSVKAPDRTIDYIFYAPSLILGEHAVIQGKTWKVSDHLPIVAEFTLSQ